MQEQEVEVFFCDLCGTSVPAADIESGKAMKHAGKTVGACCLEPLRGTAPSGDEAPKADQPKPTAETAAAASDNGRMLTVGIVLLAAIAGAVLFLDSRLARLEEAHTTAQGEAAKRRQSDSDVLMNVDVKLDRAAQRADVESAAAKVDELAKTVELLQSNTDQRMEALKTDMVGLRQELGSVTGQIVDYRPLFDDLRDRHQRALIAIEAMRVAALAQPVAATPQPVVEEATAKPVTDLPADLAAHVSKLTAADPAVRFEAVDMLGASKNAKVLPHLLPLAKDPDAFVRRLTVDVLREFQKPGSVETLLEALDDDDEYVRDTAWRSLRIVTGQKLAFEPAASKDGRKRAVQKWRDWWEKAKATFGS